MEERDPAATNGREAMKERRRTVVLLREIKGNAATDVEPSVEISNISTSSRIYSAGGRKISSSRSIRSWTGYD
jgi:hypothetical protein